MVRIWYNTSQHVLRNGNKNDRKSAIILSSYFEYLCSFSAQLLLDIKATFHAKLTFFFLTNTLHDFGTWKPNKVGHDNFTIFLVLITLLTTTSLLCCFALLRNDDLGENCPWAASPLKHKRIMNDRSFMIQKGLLFSVKL